MTRHRGLAMFALAAVVLGGNAIVAAHAWRFTHFAVGGAKTANPETLSPGDRVLVALTGVVVPRPTLGRLPAEAGLSAASAIEAGVSTWNVTGTGRGTALLFHGYGGSKSDLLDEAAVLHSAGWTTLMVDFLGSGCKEGPWLATYEPRLERMPVGWPRFAHDSDLAPDLASPPWPKPFVNRSAWGTAASARHTGWGSRTTSWPLWSQIAGAASDSQPGESGSPLATA